MRDDDIKNGSFCLQYSKSVGLQLLKNKARKSTFSETRSGVNLLFFRGWWAIKILQNIFDIPCSAFPSLKLV